MNPLNWQAGLLRLREHDRAWCLSANRLVHGRWLWRYFAAVSKAGDGWLWYAIIAALPLLDGWHGGEVALQMAVFGLISVGLYATLKRYSRRPRPLHQLNGILAPVAPLDEFSFPSGHTLHAVGFSLILISAYPALLWILLPLSFSIALSRIILGLHYPSDVLAAIGIGYGLAKGTLGVWA